MRRTRRCDYWSSLGPSPQLAWSLLNMAHIGALALDPVCARYAASALTLGAELA